MAHDDELLCENNLSFSGFKLVLRCELLIFEGSPFNELRPVLGEKFSILGSWRGIFVFDTPLIQWILPRHQFVNITEMGSGITRESEIFSEALSPPSMMLLPWGLYRSRSNARITFMTSAPAAYVRSLIWRNFLAGLLLVSSLVVLKSSVVSTVAALSWVGCDSNPPVPYSF